MKIRTSEFVLSAEAPRHYPPPDRPEIAFAGRSNVGKSSLLNVLLQRRKLARVSKTPGRTQQINFFNINDALYLVDLPGYGYAKVSKTVRRRWGPMIETYLRVREPLRAVVMLLDARHDPSDDDLQLIDGLIAFARPIIPVATKADKLSRNKAYGRQRALARTLGCDPDDVILFSSHTGQGRDALWRRIGVVLEPAADGAATGAADGGAADVADGGAADGGAADADPPADGATDEEARGA